MLGFVIKGLSHPKTYELCTCYMSGLDLCYELMISKTWWYFIKGNLT